MKKKILFILLVSHTSGMCCFHLPFSLWERGKDKARFSSGSSLFIPADIRFKSKCPTADLTPIVVFCRKKPTSICIAIQLWGLSWIHLSQAVPPQLGTVRFKLLVELISSITAWANATGRAPNWSYLRPICLEERAEDCALPGCCLALGLQHKFASSFVLQFVVWN